MPLFIAAGFSLRRATWGTGKSAERRPWVDRGLVEEFAHLLGATVGDFDTDVCLIGGKGCCESIL